MQLCARGIPPNVRAAVQDLRLHRMWMVQNLVSPVVGLSWGDGRSTAVLQVAIIKFSSLLANVLVLIKVSNVLKREIILYSTTIYH